MYSSAYYKIHYRATPKSKKKVLCKLGWLYFCKKALGMAKKNVSNLAQGNMDEKLGLAEEANPWAGGKLFWRSESCKKEV